MGSLSTYIVDELDGATLERVHEIKPEMDPRKSTYARNEMKKGMRRKTRKNIKNDGPGRLEESQEMMVSQTSS